jgi:hypothetical protein
VSGRSEIRPTEVSQNDHPTHLGGASADIPELLIELGERNGIFRIVATAAVNLEVGRSIGDLTINVQHGKDGSSSEIAIFSWLHNRN